MTSKDENITIRECEAKHEALGKWVQKLEERMEKLENRFWWIITLLIANLVGVITMLVDSKL